MATAHTARMRDEVKIAGAVRPLVRENPTKFKQFEVRYHTRGDLEIAAFNDAKGKTSYAVEVGRISKASTFLSTDEMKRLRSMFDTAMQKLSEN